ncbi:DUF4386 family protein [Nocardioides speluncae]|uniref:DUF4386 family protein n=1 Tax=Nocardioides speluncae TaxID=2670337 RepID=UPI000D699CBD|nr:DUF4386 family protein [Nocardioides speluncae]
MTTTAPAAARADVRDLRRTWRVLLACLLPIGPLGVLITRAAMPYWTDQDEATMVANIADSPGRSEVMIWAFGLTFPALVLGPLVVGYLARRGAPRLATWGAALSFLGFVMAGAIGSTDLLTHVMAQDGYDAATVVDVTKLTMAHPFAVLGIGVFIIGHIVGMILLGIAVAKAGVVARWVGIALAVSQPFHLVSAVILPSRILDLTLGWGLTTLAFVMIARALLRMSDDEFDPRPAA